MVFQPLHQLVIKQRIEHDPRCFLDLRQHPFELPMRAHQGVHMFDRQDFRVLRRGRSRDGRECLTGGVGHQVQVEIAIGALHRRT